MSFLKNIFGAPGKRGGKKVILAVDDQPSILDTIKRLLSTQYEVHCMTSYTMALKFVEKNTPDLILLDIEMPDMNGIVLLRMLREMKKLNSVPIVFLTGNSGMGNLQDVGRNGGDGFITKPIDHNFVIRIKKFLKDV